MCTAHANLNWISPESVLHIFPGLPRTIFHFQVVVLYCVLVGTDVVTTEEPLESQEVEGKENARHQSHIL